MKKKIAGNLPFEYSEYSRAEILAMNADEPLKLEVIEQIPDEEVISTYSHGSFEDLCAGPHVESLLEKFPLLNCCMLQVLTGEGMRIVRCCNVFMGLLGKVKRPWTNISKS